MDEYTQNLETQETEEFTDEMKTTIANIRLAAITAFYSLEEIEDKEIERWIRRTIIYDDPMKKMRLLHQIVSEFGKELPGRKPKQIR